MEAPERIWLQDDGDWQLYDHGDEHVTWCQDKVNDNDTEYVRADLLAEAVEALEYIMDGYGLDPPKYEQPFGDEDDWIVSRVRAALAKLETKA